MPKYGVQFVTVASSVVYVEADDPDQAGELADEEFQRPALCHHCAGKVDIGEWEFDDSEHGTWEA